MRINYFDLGLGQVNCKLCWELNEMLKILPKISDDFKIYGIEASSISSVVANQKYKNDKRVKIFNFAISKTEGKIKLYKTKYGTNGASIYDSKNNIIKNKYDIVNGKSFSNFIKSEGIDLENSFNIVKINIEGAEWDFFNDIVESGINKKINLYCGQGHDVGKIENFKKEGVVEKYYNLLEENNIKLYRFSEWKPERNEKIDILIKKLYEEELIRNK